MTTVQTVFMVINLAFAVVAAIIYGVAARKKKILCLSCKHLARYGGGDIWKFHCVGCPGATSDWPEKFDKPPKYCKYYEPKDERADR